MATDQTDNKLKPIPPGKPGNAYGRWQPGQSGNPGGRPKSKPFREALERQLAQLALSKGVPPEQGADILMAALIAKGMGGDVAAINAAMDRVEGKVPNPIGGTDELPPITAFAWKEPQVIEHVTKESTDV